MTFAPQYGEIYEVDTTATTSTAVRTVRSPPPLPDNLWLMKHQHIQLS